MADRQAGPAYLTLAKCGKYDVTRLATSVNNSLANFVYRFREGELLCHNMLGLGLGDRDGDLRRMHLPLASKM